MNDYQLYVVKDRDAMSERALNQFFVLAESSIIANGAFYVALAGGSTPQKLYEQIAKEKDRLEDWSKVHVFFGDERYVPQSHADSNYHMARQAMLKNLKHVNVYPVETDLDPESAADAYIATLHKVMGGQYYEDLPRFDLIWLGLGSDGHTASIFPHSQALRSHGKVVMAHHVEKLDKWRITFTMPVINNAKNVTFLVSGEDKADAVAHVLEGEADAERYPAQMVKPTDGMLTWLIDSEAASKLEKQA